MILESPAALFGAALSGQQGLKSLPWSVSEFAAGHGLGIFANRLPIYLYICQTRF